MLVIFRKVEILFFREIFVSNMSTLKPTYTSLKFRAKIHYTTVRAVSVKSKAKLGFSLISEASGELLKL